LDHRVSDKRGVPQKGDGPFDGQRSRTDYLSIVGDEE
jgi:hypothetical protein